MSRKKTSLKRLLPRRLLLVAGLAALVGRRALNTPADLTGKSVLITGGSRGLGLALGREFAARGAHLTLMARDALELDRAAADLRGRGARVITVVGDVTVDADIARALDAAEAEYGRLDVLANVAGIIQTGPLANMTEADFREIMEINTFGPLKMTRAALPLLRAVRGRVLLVASVGGKVGIPHLAPYSVSKFALVGLGQVLRAELAQEGITVTTVCPGLMQTGSARNATVKGQHAREYALFATLDNLPVISMAAPEAARRMVNATVRGDAEAMIGGPAVLLRTAQAIAPQLTADLMALGNRFLPRPTPSDRGVMGKHAESQITQKNPIKRAAEAEFNE
ncbi:SDR family oxidoreductase [Deinococcus sp. QL22]|uniref:SDR family NAD(P)-dependent oxidoreductase n=1 Tax=Deinococcus sp. QL22 TaxID=2939437 RepID=UPI00201752AC|nr:SDR family NAD(P)-dependent oxidoreductase [Deinococcus sp. QL22]UQN05814.1 SDR family NAD(P)-dependent oxidoreductase [Deinococcus sp. QL22]